MLWCQARGHNKRSLWNKCPKHLIVKHLATLGPYTALGDITEGRILFRIVRWVKTPHGSGRERIVYEADPRYAELIIHQLTLIIHQLALGSSSRSQVRNRYLELMTAQYSTALTTLWIDLPAVLPRVRSARWMQATTVGNLRCSTATPDT